MLVLVVDAILVFGRCYVIYFFLSDFDHSFVSFFVDSLYVSYLRTYIANRYHRRPQRPKLKIWKATKMLIAAIPNHSIANDCIGRLKTTEC